MKYPHPPRPGVPGPRRPHEADSYQTAGVLPDLFRRSETDGGVYEIDFSLTPKRPTGDWRDTYSNGVMALPSGEYVNICTSYSRRGTLLLETPVGCRLSLGQIADIARAVVEAHVREQGRAYRRGPGRN